MYRNTFTFSEEDYLMHYGVKRRSGRYPWGSGDNPYQHSGDFLSRVEQMQKEGFTYTDEKGKTYSGETAIAKSMGYSTTELRTLLSIAKSDRRQILVTQAKDLRAKGYSLDEIAKQMGYENDSSVRSLLNADSEKRMLAATATFNHLKEQVNKKGMIEVGKGVERELGISREKFDQALAMMRFEGYEVYGVGVRQVTNKGQQTTMTILCPPGTQYSEAYKAATSNDVKSLADYTSADGGDTFEKTWIYPKSMDSKRLDICYAEDGGIDKDGLIEIRRNVPDLDLGYSKYAQVRILVDDKRYIKGMAVYSDDLPDGIDVRFNTNKDKSVDKMDVLKKIKDDPTNPFGSLIKDGVDDPANGEKGGGQSYYYDKNGKKQLSLINKRAEEGDWDEWANKLSSQFLSKQNIPLIKKQLKLEIDSQTEEYQKICELTNPTIKRKLLDEFASNCDSAAVHLKAAALPRQHYQVILPLTSIKETEVYAPNYKDGETVALVRYPHGGTFEIPILKVNNKNKEGKAIMGTDPKDAIGISAKTAAGLSGADFDGDTVMVIPCNDSNNKTRITSTYDQRKTDPSLKSLGDFDPKMSYGPAKVAETKDKSGKIVEHAYRDDGTEYKLMSKELTQKEMGKVSNLITDMTLKGAPTADIVKAVKHSMVVIDANKHHLDYKQSEIDNDIATLKNRWQGHYKENGNWGTGAGTLISRASAQDEVLKRQGTPKVNEKGKSWYDSSKPEGSLIYKTADDLYYTDKNGKTKARTQKSTQMAETEDAHTLSTGHPKEEIYAEYANTMKEMARKARLESSHTGRLEYSPTANKAYSEEVTSLKAKLDRAERNKPRERMAQLEATAIVNAKKADNPDMTAKEIKKASQIALNQARKKLGAERTEIEITDNEWKAIQAGAISDSVLKKILDKADTDKVRERATPRSSATLTAGQRSRIKALAANGYTQAEIASQMGISTSTVSKYIG